MIGPGYGGVAPGARGSVSFNPTRESYGYRWTSLHLISIPLFVAGMLAPLGFGIQAVTKDHASALQAVLAGLQGIAFCLPFVAGGVFLWMMGWNSKVLMQTGMIVSVNWLGKTTFEAPYAALQDLKTFTGPQGGTALTIVTADGTITVQGMIRHFGELESNLQRLLTIVRGAHGPIP